MSEGQSNRLVTITSHAIQRYMERSGQTCPDRAAKTIQKMFRRSIPIEGGNGRWYGSGWIFAVKNGRMITVMRPRKERVMKSIKEAHEREKHDEMIRKITGALKSCIDAHGPIFTETIGSAAKRIAGALKPTPPAP